MKKLPVEIRKMKVSEILREKYEAWKLDNEELSKSLNFDDWCDLMEAACRFNN
jgi:aryl carrier-like protein